MEIVINARDLDKISKTLLAVDKIAKFEYLGEGAEDGVRISTSSPSYAYCVTNIKRGWTEDIRMTGSVGEEFVIDISVVRAVLRELKGGKSDMISLVNSPESKNLTLKTGGFEKEIVKIDTEVKKYIPEPSSEIVKFRIGGSKVKRILNEIKATNDTITISMGDYNIMAQIGPDSQEMKGYGVCFWSTETDELIVSNESLPTATQISEPFSAKYLVESLDQAIKEARAKEERMEIQLGPEAPIQLKFRIAESVFVEYTQVPKKVITIPS